MVKRLKEILKKYKFSYWRILKRDENKDLLEFINNWSEKLYNHKLSTKIFWILHNIHDFPKCKNCGKTLDKDSDIQLEDDCYHTYCSNKCATGSKERNEKRRVTNLNKYGCTAPILNNDIKQKIIRTNIERYGSKSSFSSEEVKSKIKNTNIERYGVEHVMKNENIKRKLRETCIERYGTVNGGCSKDALKKIEDTNMRRYGVKSSFDREEVRNKAKETFLKRYGTYSYLASDESKEYRNGPTKKSYDETILNNEYDEPMFSFEEYLRVHKKNRYSELKFRCKRCGKIFSAFHTNGTHRRCPECYPRNIDFEENEIFEFLKSIYHGEIIYGIGGKKIISPLELDFYIPEKKIAFEFDGLYWHSEENGKDEGYHLYKTEECEKLDIQLIHIFEDEWIDKNKIVKDRIKNLLGIYTNTVYARKCVVKEVDKTITRKFMNNYHIQGDCVSKVNIGLFFNDELVSMMTFGKSRFNKNYEWELLRFCNKEGYHVIGGAGKLLKYFEREFSPLSLISYADRRWSIGNLYRKLGFKEIESSRPAYFYIKRHCRFSRILFQKHKLKDKLEKFDESISEVENMKNNGYYRIWDCGNRVFKKEY